MFAPHNRAVGRFLDLVGAISIKEACTGVGGIPNLSSLWRLFKRRTQVVTNNSLQGKTLEPTYCGENIRTLPWNEAFHTLITSRHLKGREGK